MATAKVGMGIIIENKDGKVLIGKRKGSFAEKYSIPGGKLDEGEHFEEGIAREILEETGIQVRNPKVIALTNNLETYKEDGVHFISIIFHTKEFTGTPKIMEPDKCESWDWYDPKELPEPHFDASRYGIKCWLEGKFYVRPGKLI